MDIWFVFALMTAAAAFAILWPLGRRPAAAAAASADVAVYRDQLGELERDRRAGLIGPAEAEAARVEVGRRLLSAADRADARVLAPAPWRRRAAAAAALILLPLAAIALYARLGAPNLPAAPLAERKQAPLASRSIDSLVAQVEAHLALNPEDGRGWEVLAPVYLRLGRFDDAVKARRNALRLLGATAAREADYGEALVAAANGVVTADAREAFERALKLEPRHPKAQFLLGLAAEQDGRREEAAARWRALLAEAPADAPWAEPVRSALARLTGTPAEAGPSAEEMTAAESMDPQARSAMVRGMVERLAARLQQDGSDVDGWLRLMRAYMVLAEPDKARAAAADARRALAGDGEKLRQVEDLAKSLGLES